MTVDFGTLHLSPLKFFLPLIYASRVVKIKESELQTRQGWRKLKAGETRQVYNGPRLVKFISAKRKFFLVKNDF